MSVFTYLRHRTLYWTRHPSHGSGTVSGQAVLILLLLIVMGLFVYGPLAAAGWFLPAIVADLAPRARPLDVANQWFLWSFTALIPVRFVMHSPTHRASPAYLTLPLETRPLIHTRLGLELVSLHTLVPLSIGIPVLIRIVAPSFSLPETAAWAVCLLAATMAYSYAGILLNEALGRRSRLFWSMFGGAAVLFAADWLVPFDVFFPLSSALMSQPMVAAPLLAGVAACLYGLLFDIRQTSYIRGVDAEQAGNTFGIVSDAIEWIGAFGETGRATALELRLITRHRRTRGLCAMLLVVGPMTCYAHTLTEYAPGLLLAIQYVSMGFPYGYGAILFSGDHKHLEGTVARTSNASLLVRGKVRAMQLMTATMFVLILPSLMFLPVQDALFIVAWLPFGVFVIAPLSVYFAASTRKPIDLNTSAFAPSSSSFHMFPLVFPLFVVFAGVFAYMQFEHWAFTVLPLVMGGAGAAATPHLIRRSTRKLERRKYRLLHAFRSTETA